MCAYISVSACGWGQSSFSGPCPVGPATGKRGLWESLRDSSDLCPHPSVVTSRWFYFWNALNLPCFPCLCCGFGADPPPLCQGHCHHQPLSPRGVGALLRGPGAPTSHRVFSPQSTCFLVGSHQASWGASAWYVPDPTAGTSTKGGTPPTRPLYSLQRDLPKHSTAAGV